MMNLERRLRSLDELSAPDLYGEIERRVGAPAGVSASDDSLGWEGGKRFRVALLALVLFLAAVSFLWAAFIPDGGEQPADTRTADPWAWAPEGWSELPPVPAHRDASAWVWTGRQLLVWGGYDEKNEVDVADGYAFDPETKAWASLPPAPVARTGASAVWTGREAIFWGGWDRDGNRMDGVAFNPQTESWRTIASAPIPARHAAVVIWTGTEMIVWGGGGRDDPSTNRSGAAYDPVTDSWHTIADAPLGLNLASGTWTGREVIVFGSLLNDRNWAATDTSVGAAYDPRADSWRRMPASDLSPQATSAAWVGDRMVAWDFEVRAQEYFPEADRWSEPVRMPLDFSECYPDSRTVGRQVFAWFCGRAAEYDVATGEWQEIQGGVTEPTIEAHGRPYKLYRFASLVAAGDVVVVAATGITVDEDGVPCYGCPGAPESMWIYRPPAVAS
jgi:hypothetical protein